jgi:hypothetical protein
MPNKASPAGWVVQVATLGPEEAAPLFRYFNVAMADADQAVAATRQKAGVTSATRVEAVRALSAAEIAALHLKTGAVSQHEKPRACNGGAGY